MGGSNQKPPLVEVWIFSGIAHLREKNSQEPRTSKCV